MIAIVLDTETTSLNKPFVYNIGYVIVDMDTGEELAEHDLVIEQVWHNPMLFASAYYGEKRPIYVKALRSRKSKLMKFGRAMKLLEKEIEKFHVTNLFGYNTQFDYNAIKFNCSYYKLKTNPIEKLIVRDIHKIALKSIDLEDYKNWCEVAIENDMDNFLTAKKNYATTAETMYSYFAKNYNFKEDHTALSDSKIELYILTKCDMNVDDTSPIPFKSLVRN
jgi:DNA polymerase III epsilon subunit-like protein